MDQPYPGEMYKQYYERMLAANATANGGQRRLHFAAHSHHPWPDCTRPAVVQCWDDATEHLDAKWDYLFQTVIPTARSNVAKWIGSQTADQLVFAPNTHEFVVRLLSCLPLDAQPQIVTSDAEFHSFSRQIDWLEKNGCLRVHRIASRPAATFVQRVSEHLRSHHCDLCFVSYVFFDSGLCIGDVQPLVDAADPATMLVVDAYHGFAARPMNIDAVADRVFWIGGGYKYAQSGEGACWLHVPTRHTVRPRNTGWFAAFGALAESPTDIPFASDGRMFAGATFDPTGLYRWNAVAAWCDEIGLTPSLMHDYVRGRQDRFLQQLGQLHGPLSREQLILEDLDNHGHFFAFALPNNQIAGELHRQLWDLGIVTDYRGNRLRIGFGLYHDDDDIDELLTRMESLP